MNQLTDEEIIELRMHVQYQAAPTSEQQIAMSARVDALADEVRELRAANATMHSSVVHGCCVTLEEARAALRQLDEDYANRMHGGVAQDKAVRRIRDAMGAL